MDLIELERRDGLRTIRLPGGSSVYIHKDHRWDIPILWAAQEKGAIPRPSTLISFDAHHDALKPTCCERLKQIRSQGLSLDKLISLCETDLRKLDDDWIRAAMELGLVDNAVVFGVYDRSGALIEDKFRDHTGGEHRIFPCGLPGGELNFQGKLSNFAQSDVEREPWSALEWRPAKYEKHCFGSADRKLFLTIDLDCFVVDWRDYLFPWPEEVYEAEFDRPSTYWSTEGWTGKLFFEALVQLSGAISLAREPDHCGGEEKADIILQDVNRFLFDQRLKL